MLLVVFGDFLNNLLYLILTIPNRKPFISMALRGVEGAADP
jgi:hypothetical protein